MAEVSDTWGTLYQNLLDAGCDCSTANACLALLRQNKTAELRQLLSSYRFCLMDDLHHQQRKIDCLDFLLYRLEKGLMGK